MTNEQNEFLLDIGKLIHFANQQGILLTGGECYRTKEQQELHFKAGRSKTMNSNHLRRLAMDFNFFINGVLTYEKKDVEILGDFWESLNSKNRWGGYWKFADTPHFERNV